MAWQTTARHLGICMAASVVCYCLRFLPPDGADGFFISKLIEDNPFPVYYRSILTVWMHKLCYLTLSPTGFSGWDALAVSSSIAGGIAILGLLLLSKHPLFILANVLSGSFLVFYGHHENYAWVNAFLILSYACFFRWCNGELPLAYGILFYMLACLSHMLALFYAPAILFLIWKKRDYNPVEVLMPLMVFVFLILILPAFFTLLGTDNSLERLVPVFQTWAPNQFFTLFSVDHLKMLGYFHYRASFLGIVPIPGTGWFLGLPIEIPLLVLLRKRINTLFLRFMLINVICGIVWTTLWHPDWGYNDWDLFSQFGIPLHVLLGVLLTQRYDEQAA